MCVIGFRVLNWRSEACCLLFGSLASIASVFLMCSRVLDGESLLIVRSLLHLCVPVAHRGDKCLRSVFE